MFRFNDNIRFIPQNDEHLTINLTGVRVTTLFVDLGPLSELYTIIPFVRHREHNIFYKIKLKEIIVVYYTYHSRYIHTYIHSDIHTYVRTYVHTYIHTYVRTYIHTYRHTYIRTYVRTYIHTYIRTYIHTDIHTYIHTYIHECIHT